MQYKEGDIVQFRQDLIEGKQYDGFSFMAFMKMLKGKTVQIESVSRDNESCYIKGSGNNYAFAFFTGKSNSKDIYTDGCRW